MTTKQDIVTAVADVLTAVPLPVKQYPADVATISSTLPVVIVQEMRARTNTAAILASGTAVLEWTVEVLAIVAWGRTVYPSADSAANDILANDYEQTIVSALLDAQLPNAVQNQRIMSTVGEYQWMATNNKLDAVWAVQVLLPVEQIIEL